jgi:hypothetical protein
LSLPFRKATDPRVKPGTLGCAGPVDTGSDHVGKICQDAVDLGQFSGAVISRFVFALKAFGLFDKGCRFPDAISR